MRRKKREEKIKRKDGEEMCVCGFVCVCVRGGWESGESEMEMGVVVQVGVGHSLTGPDQ